MPLLQDVICTMKNQFLRELPLKTQTILLGSFVFLGLVVGVALAMLVGSVGYGIPMLELAQVAAQPTPERAAVILWMNNASQCGSFLFPVVLFVFLFGKNNLTPFRLKLPIWVFIAAPLWVIASNGVIDLVSQLNTLLIPEGSLLERLFKPAEEQGNALISLFLKKETGLSLSLILLSMAIIPALCEELLFRGLLQPLLVRVTGKKHLAIWVTAALFSFIHFQFYGFLPRMVLGALLGYLVIWTQSIWPAILAHFTNNALAVVLFYQNGEQLTPPTPSTNDMGIYLSSILLTAGLGWFFYRNRIEKPTGLTSSDLV